MSDQSIVILVGTDHHRFDRVVAWADRRQRAHPEGRVYVQYGQSTPPADAAGAAFVSPVELRSLVSEADVVITHGGPGTIHDARSAGHRPIVLPRDPGHGEHVDDHQQRFGAWCQERGLVSLARTVDELDPLLDALGAPGTRVESTEAGSRASVALVEALVAAPSAPGRGTPGVLGAPVVLNVAAATDQAGRTTLENAFCDVSGALVLGRVTDVWSAALGDDVSCACGKRFTDCPFWVAVGRQAYDGWEGVAADELTGLSSPTRALTVSDAVRRHPGASRRSELLRRAGHQRRVFAAALEVSGASVVIESGDLVTLLTQSHDRHLDVRLLATRPAAARAGTLAVAAAHHRRVPVLAVPSAAAPSQLTRLVSTLGAPAPTTPLLEHQRDVRLRRS